MTNDITDRERIWTDTQEWLDDIDRDEPGADFDAPAADLGSVADDDHNDAPLPASAASAADGGDDQADYGPADDNDRSAHIDTAPVDLDAAGPDPAAGNADAPDTADHPDPAPTAHTPADTEGTAQPDDPHTPGDTNHTPRPPRYNKKIAAGFAVATVVAALAVSGALLAMRSGPHTADARPQRPPQHPGQRSCRAHHHQRTRRRRPGLHHPLHGHLSRMPARIHRRPIGRRPQLHPSLGLRAPAATSANTSYSISAAPWSSPRCRSPPAGSAQTLPAPTNGTSTAS